MDTVNNKILLLHIKENQIVVDIADNNGWVIWQLVANEIVPITDLTKFTIQPTRAYQCNEIMSVYAPPPEEFMTTFANIVKDKIKDISISDIVNIIDTNKDVVDNTQLAINILDFIINFKK